MMKSCDVTSGLALALLHSRPAILGLFVGKAILVQAGGSRTCRASRGISATAELLVTLVKSDVGYILCMYTILHQQYNRIHKFTLSWPSF